MKTKIVSENNREKKVPNKHCQFRISIAFPLTFNSIILQFDRKNPFFPSITFARSETLSIG